MSPPRQGGSSSLYDEDELGKVLDIGLVRRLGAYLRPYRGWVVVAILLAILAAALRVLTPLIAREVIDNCIPVDTPERRRGLMNYTLAYLALLVVLFWTNFFLAYLTAWIGQHSMYDLRKALFRKVHALSMGFFDRTPSGRLLTRCTSDVQVLNEFFSQGVVYIFADIVLLLGIIAAWFHFDWRLACLLLAMGPLLGIAAYHFKIKARATYRAVRLRIAALNAFLQENLAGIRAVQAFTHERESLARYSGMCAHYCEAQVDAVRQFARFFPLVELISTLAVCIVLAYSGWKMHGGTLSGQPLTPGLIYLYIQYIGWFFMPIQELAEKFNVFQGAMASAERLFFLMDEPVDVPEARQPADVPPLAQGVELRDVWFAYGRPPGAAPAPAAEPEWVLRGVSLRVERGQTVALVGATGAGKSTVINLITRLYDVSKGQVLFDGADVKGLSQAALRSRMAIVLQDVFLFSGTIADNIRLGNRDISDAQVEEAARHVNAHGFITRLPQGYQSPVLERGATLSSGQKQLLAFARAVAFNPDLLILDEATANIDTETEALIQDALARLMRERTCIVVAHRLSTIQNANRIVVFHHGKIHEEGTHQELLQRDGLYRRLYELQYKL